MSENKNELLFIKWDARAWKKENEDKYNILIGKKVLVELAKKLNIVPRLCILTGFFAFDLKEYKESDDEEENSYREDMNSNEKLANKINAELKKLKLRIIEKDLVEWIEKFGNVWRENCEWSETDFGVTIVTNTYTLLQEYKNEIKS